MSDTRPRDTVSTLVTLPLRYGTLVAVAVIAAGLLAGIGQPVDIERAPLPFPDVLAAGGASAIIAVGLLLLSLVPLAMAMAAAVAFARRGEPRYLAASVLVAALLVASLVVSAALLTG